MTAHVERRRLSRRMVTPYFRVMGYSHGRELSLLGLLLLLLVLTGWYFRI